MKTIFAVGSVLLLSVSAAHAQTTSIIRSWDEQGFTVAGLAEGRIGNAAQAPNSNFTYEADIQNSNFAVTAQRDFNWQNGVATDWTLAYNAASGALNYNVGGTNGVSMQSTMTPGERFFEDIFIRVYRGDFSGASTSISDLVYNGVALNPGGVSQNTFSGVGDAIRIDNISPLQGFLLTGKTTFTWDGTATPTARPRQSQLAYQVKLGTQAPGNAIPEAGSLALLLPVLVGGIALVARRKH